MMNCWREIKPAPEHWLERDSEATRPEEVYSARVEGQTITIETPPTGKLTLRLSDALVDLDQPIHVFASGKPIFEGPVRRNLSAITQSLRERADAGTVATALLPVSW